MEILYAIENQIAIIESAIDKRLEMAIRITQDLTRLPSIGDEGAVSAYIKGFLTARGIQYDSFEPDMGKLRPLRGFVPVDYGYEGRENVVAVISGRGGGKSLALNGHMDTVPADDVKWKHGSPFSGALEDGKIYGRGSLDMKCGIAIALVLLDALTGCGISLDGDLQFHFVVDEENGGNGTLAVLDRGYRPDAIIFLESTSPGIIVAANRGAQFFKITVPGVETGVLRMASNVNAIDKAALIINGVRGYYEKRNAAVSHPLYEVYHELGLTVVPVSICTINGGNWPSTLPGKIVMRGTIECLPGEDITEEKEKFKAYLEGIFDSDDWMKLNRPEIEWFGLQFEASENKMPCAIAETVRREAKIILGNEPVVTGAGGCDLRIPLLGYGIPSILYGAGGSNEHSTNEYVDIESIALTAKIIARAVLRWCGKENG